MADPKSPTQVGGEYSIPATRDRSTSQMREVSDANPLAVKFAGGAGGSTVAIDQTTQGVSNGVDQTSVTIGNSSIVGNATGADQVLVAASAATRSILIINEGTTPWYMRTDGGVATASANAPNLVLNSGDAYSPAKPPKNAIHGIGTLNSSLYIDVGT